MKYNKTTAGPVTVKFPVRSIIKLGTITSDETSSYWSGQKAPNFSAFHWLPHGCLITIGQHFVTTRVVHVPKRVETSLITESDQSKAIHQLCMIRTAWSNLDQAVRAVHSCKSWLQTFIRSKENPISSVNLSVNTGICLYR